MAQCHKHKVKLSFDSDISSPEEKKKICQSPRSHPDINTVSDEGEDEQVLEALNMTERIASQLEMICQTLASVENRLEGDADVFTLISPRKLLSLNVRGIRSTTKRKALFTWLNERKYDVIFLQETYSIVDVEDIWKTQWQGKLHFIHGSNPS